MDLLLLLLLVVVWLLWLLLPAPFLSSTGASWASS
jgi:hypothetical protein